MRKLMSLSFVLVLSVLVGFGCGKTPKVNLIGLEENPAGSYNEDGTPKGATPGENYVGGNGGGLEPLGLAGFEDQNALNGTAGANVADANGANGANDANGAWNDTAAGLAGAGDAAAAFVKDGQYWNEKVYFDFNRYEVRPAERVKLDSLAEYLRANPTFVVVIEGHCDERGSDEYNRSLSERRSISVLEYLTTLGIGAERFQTVSYGEDRPAFPNARTEKEHQGNRRAEFLVGLPLN